LAGKGYYDRAEVRDLLFLLRALDNPFDDLALAIVLRSPLYALSDETLYRLRREDKPLREALRVPPDDIVGAERVRVEFACASLERLWARVGRVPILDLLKDALAETDYLATLTFLADGDRRRANVEKLLALARRTGLVRLSEFNAYLQDLTAQEVREGEAVIQDNNALRLMSIHRAKGLEFPLIVIPDASRAPRERTNTLIADRRAGVAVTVRDARGETVKPIAYRWLKLEAERQEAAEEKRLLYVAATRAQDYLIISGSKKAEPGSYLKYISDALDGRTMFDWGTVEIREPSVEFTQDTSPLVEDSGSTKEALTPSSALPPLVFPLPQPTVHDLRSFTPTGLQILTRDRAEFERHVLAGAPERVASVLPRAPSQQVPAYIIGEMAHRAIQRWRLPNTTPNLEAVLEGYAGERGLMDASEIRAAVRAAIALLHRFVQSDLYREMDSAIVRQHEVPFVVQWKGRIVHGALDALYQSAQGEWFVADFKTDRLRDAEAHAYTLREYGVQLALYQYAVTTQLGDVVMRVHYIREGVTLALTRTDLASPLAHAQECVMRM